MLPASDVILEQMPTERSVNETWAGGVRTRDLAPVRTIVRTGLFEELGAVWRFAEGFNGATLLFGRFWRMADRLPFIRETP